MNVDRARFLHLVTVIAGTTVACGAQQEAPPAIMVPVDVSPSDASAPLATSPRPAETSADSRASTPPPTAEDASAPVAKSGGIWTLPYDATKKPYACGDLKCPGPTQEAMSALRGACKTIQGRLSSEPFQRFMTCMMSRNNTSDTCDLKRVGESPGECLEGWYETPKADPAMAAKCKPVVAACSGANRSVHASGKSISSDDCVKILSVTNPGAMPKMIHCVTEYCGEALRLCHGGYG